jgi:hypothetical protein
MHESSDHDVMAARVEHPDLDEAVDWDEHGPVFEAILGGLDDPAPDQGMAGTDA